jgi:hypothetical protein
MNLTDYVMEWIFDSTAGKDPVNFLIHICPPSGKPYLVRGERGIIFNDPTREILVSLNEPSGSRDCLRRSPWKNLAKLK